MARLALALVDFRRSCHSACIIITQFRAGMTAELSGQTRYAVARPGQVMFWSIIFGAFYAALFTAAVGFLF
jgi:hypothetical protein